MLTASQPFTTALIHSNIKQFRQTLVWLKNKPMNFMNANKMFMKWHEDICIFGTGRLTYNPQKTKGKVHKNGNNRSDGNVTQYSKGTQRIITISDEYHPKSVLEFPIQHLTGHPTEKPVPLFEFLIRTYTNPGDTVLDNTCGSGTTLVAAINTGRSAIGIERDEGYFRIASERVRAARAKAGPVIDLAAFRRVAEWNRAVARWAA